MIVPCSLYTRARARKFPKESNENPKRRGESLFALPRLFGFSFPEAILSGGLEHRIFHLDAVCNS